MRDSIITMEDQDELIMRKPDSEKVGLEDDSKAVLPSISIREDSQLRGRLQLIFDQFIDGLIVIVVIVIVMILANKF